MRRIVIVGHLFGLGAVLVVVGLLARFSQTAVAGSPDLELEIGSGELETAVSLDTLDTVCTGDNLLTNPSFEGDYVPYTMAAPGHPDCQTWNADEPNQYCERVKVADGWHPWWRGDLRDEGWQNIQPEYVPSLSHEMPPRLHEGEKGQHYFSFWSTHEAGLYQQIEAEINGRYCFSIWGHAWSSATSLPDFTSDPNNHGTLRQKVGIDPMGGTDWESDNIIWSDARLQYDEFGLFVVEATAQADTITVFMHSAPELPTKHNDVYWDDAVLAIDKLLTVSTEAIFLMMDVDEPTIVTRTIEIEVTPAMSWTAVLNSGGTLIPQLSVAAGSDDTLIEISIDSSGLAVGTYTASFTISSGAGVANSPTTILITLAVVPEIWDNFLPFIKR